MTLRKFAGLGALLSIVMPSLAMAADEVAAPVLNSGDTAWMLTATALVLFMTIPGLALFYGGMVRSKNILSVMMQCFAITGLISILWVVYGYSIAFDTTGMEQGVVNFNSFFGGMGKAFLAGVTPASITGSAALFPEAVFITFQMTFAIITPALIVGAFAERMKFSAMLIFMGIWFTLVYAPIAHMVWSGNGGLMWDWGVLDFAGGTVVHINAGVAGLVACIVLGKRKGFPTTPMAPHNLGYTLIGAAMLWIGWFGFNVMSAQTLDGVSGLVAVNSLMAMVGGTVAALIIGRNDPGFLHNGPLAGLVAICAGSDLMHPVGALVTGAVAGGLFVWCFIAAQDRWKIDDVLGVWPLHGLCGVWGGVACGIFGQTALGGLGGVSLISQLIGTALGVVVALGGGLLVYGVIKRVHGLRLSQEEEYYGADLSIHKIGAVSQD